VWRKGWWDAYSNDIDRRFIDLLWPDSRAERLRTYEAMLVPGLLQTREYAETLIRNVATADTLPLRRGAHAVLDGSFWLYEMPDLYPDVAYVDNLAGAVYVEDDAAVDRFRQAYHQLSATALGGKESAALIAAVAKKL
jgi:Domain of unknown function (DUF5753)